jgi:hypothetical protein
MTQIDLHPGQSRVLHDLFVTKKNRYGVVNAGRGWGKSYCAGVAGMMAVQELVQLPANVPNKNVAIIAPTYAQAVDIYFPLIAYMLGAENYCLKMSRSAGKFWFPNNVELKIWSYEASERMRGSGQYFVVADEVTSWKGAGMNLQESWESIIQPCITTRWSPKNAKRLGAPSPGRGLIISTPKGNDYFYDMFNSQDTDPLWQSYHYTYRDSPFLDEEEIERVKHNLDPLKFAREYEASFEDSGANVFYMFDRKKHIRNDLDGFHDTEDVHIGIDFNVGIQASTVFAIRGGQMHVLDELMGHPDTETLAKAIKSKYSNGGKRKIYCYPDPSGRSRKTSAAVGTTDFSILQQSGLVTLAHKKAPPIIDSVNAVNKKLENAHGAIELLVSAKATNVIKSLERTSWVENNPDTATISKKEGVEHFSDGIRYAVEYVWPVQNRAVSIRQGSQF